MKKLTLLSVLVGIAILSSSFVVSPVPPAKKLLAFPVAGKKSNIGSFWGASRDGGRRKHKGIDIFASKGTPVVAITDGVIVERGNTPIGGKVLWLKSSTHGWTAYYAHLDKQSVKEGQYVRKGQVIGTVGKTGNARYTPAHLHFGIYRERGPINPLPYVKNAPKVLLKKATAKRKTTVAKKSVRKRRA
ncbi:MAG TPA: M23 family metallopeptidase [Flavisolibacter sp.]|nr:M23 family metallopeptidase [Flavisolibacter sp.]